MRTNFNNPNKFFFFSALLLFFSQILNAQTLSLQLTASDFNGYNISCFGNQNGTIDLTVSGGTAPYTFQWSNDAQTEDLSELPSGYYNVTVTDSNGQTAEAEITLTEPKPIKIELTVYKYPNGFNISQNGSCNGNVSATVNGGVTPYTYHWNPGNQTTINPTNLCAGMVIVEVVDNNGCRVKENTVLSQPEKDSWLTSGNGNTDPANQFIGTIDNNDFVIRTNGEERMRFKSDGKITMLSPNYFQTLRVNRITSPDSILYIGDSTILYMKPTNNFSADQSGGLYNSYKGIGFGQLSYARGTNSIGMGYNARAEGNNSFAFGNNLFIPNTTNNSFTIGTGISPASRLVNTSLNTLYLGFNSNIPTLVVTPASGIIGETGSVYIGLPDPTILPTSITNFKLAVNGKILCEEVKVQGFGNWDRVFEKDYNFLTQEELAKYLIEYHHLPNFPSYEEMKKEDGISVGDFQMKLLRTIEEQALYILNQDKRLSDQEKRIAQLEKENSEHK